MSDLPTTTLGRTGVEVTRLGYGAMELRGGNSSMEPAAAASLLNAVLDAGINFIDTSPDYGDSEARIGEAISHRREEYFLASKCGCPINYPGHQAPHIFTRKNVRAGVEQSLVRMRTDHLDLVQFHASPSRDLLEENDSVAELEQMKQEGKIRFIGMSGTLPNLIDHIDMGVFDAFQIPHSLLEPEHDEWITKAGIGGAGTIIRGGVARGAPAAEIVAASGLAYRHRQVIQERKNLWGQAGLDDLRGDMSIMEFMLRFTISHPHMSTTIVGTSKMEHLQDNLEAARKGPLPSNVYAEAKRRVDAVMGPGG